MTWKILLKRESLDVTTISMADKIFYNLIEEYLGNHGESMFSHYSKDFLTHYIKVDHNDFGIKLFKRKYNSIKKIKRYYDKGKIFLKEQKKISLKAKKLIKKDEIHRAFNLFLKDYEYLMDVYSIGSWSAIEAWQNYFEERLIEHLNKKHISFEKIVGVLYRPWKKTSITKLQEDIRKGVSRKKLESKYDFLGSWNLCWQKDFKIGNLSTPSLKGKKVDKRDYSKIIKELNSAKDIKKDIKLLPYILFFKDYRDEIRRYHAYLWRFLFKAIANFFGLTLKELGYLTLKEIENSLREKTVNYNLIKNRIEKEFILTRGSKKVMVVKDKISKRYSDIMSRLNKDIRFKKEVKGIIAQRGIVKGKVKIVNSFLDSKKVKKGEIIIANVTHPDYLSAMYKASAFVTNEGGMISHAAIIAREMKKPCIVEAENATKIFEDGDMVEVDANKGIVRKL